VPYASAKIWKYVDKNAAEFSPNLHFRKAMVHHKKAISQSERAP
jgi:hypothetical protein